MSDYTRTWPRATALDPDEVADIATYWSQRPWVTDVAKQRGHTFNAAIVQQLCDEDTAALADFRAHHRAYAAWNADQEPYGDPVGYGRTPADDRLRAIFWCLVVPVCYVGVAILGWAVGTALREWLR